MTILEENFKWHLEAFASELFTCIRSCVVFLRSVSPLHMLCCKEVIGPLPGILVWVEDGLSNVWSRLV